MSEQREIKFRYLFGIEGKLATYLTAVFTLDQIESGDQFEYLSDNPLLKDYRVLARDQWAEMLDKNDDEIYHNDIAEYGYESVGNGYVSIVRPVVFDPGMGYYLGGAQSDINPQGAISGSYSENVKVLGNIHSNPELLEKAA